MFCDIPKDGVTVPKSALCWPVEDVGSPAQAGIPCRGHSQGKQAVPIATMCRCVQAAFPGGCTGLDLRAQHPQHFTQRDLSHSSWICSPESPQQQRWSEANKGFTRLTIDPAQEWDCPKSLPEQELLDTKQEKSSRNCLHHSKRARAWLWGREFPKVLLPLL